ncbi:MAG: plastocyanin/azurin family copper-binding protein [Gammaproteobacteria bacterium]
MRKIYLASAALILLTSTQAVMAENATVTARSTAYDPIVVFIEPGDTVVWTSMAGHNSVTIPELIPDGAEGFNIPMGENGSATLEQEGVYVYKCEPHFAMGMGGAIVVGNPGNFEDVKANAKGMAKRIVIKTQKALEEKGML